MKPVINNLAEALSFQLKGLYDAERRLANEIPACVSRIEDEELRREINAYAASAGDKMLKLERIFSYLMVEPYGKKNVIVDGMITEAKNILECTNLPLLKSFLLASCIKNLNQYKLSTLQGALSIAVELELDSVADLLTELIEWEKLSYRSLQKISAQHVANEIRRETDVFVL